MARRCRMQGCEKYAVRQGVCVSHGAKVHHARCTVAGCTKFAVRTGLCVSHGAKKPFCKVEGCVRQAQQKGVCVAHGAKKAHCKTPGCVRQAVRGGMCKSHSPTNSEPTCAHPTCTKTARKGPFCSGHRRSMQTTSEGGVMVQNPQASSSSASGRAESQEEAKAEAKYPVSYYSAQTVQNSGKHPLGPHDAYPQSQHYYGSTHDGRLVTGYTHCLAMPDRVANNMMEMYSICAIDGCDKFAKLHGKCIGHSVPLGRNTLVSSFGQ